MNNIIHKIRQIYPVSEEALQALLMNMQVRSKVKRELCWSVWKSKCRYK